MFRRILCLLLLLAPAAPADELGDLLRFDLVKVNLGEGLVVLVSGKAPLLIGVPAVRHQLESEQGLLLPSVRFRDDDMLGPKEYVIFVREQEVGRGQVEPKMVLAVPPNPSALAGLRGAPGQDPATGSPGRWVAAADRTKAEKAGCLVYSADALVCRHLKKAALSHGDQIWGRQELLGAAPPLLAGAFSSDVAAQDRCLQVCHNLLQESVPLLITSVGELVLDRTQARQDADSLSEKARLAVKTRICQHLAPSKTIIVASLGPALESKLRTAVSFGPNGLIVADQAALENALEGPVTRAVAALKGNPVLCVADDLRLAVHRLTQRKFPQVTVLARSEVAPGYSLRKALEI